MEYFYAPIQPFIMHAERIGLVAFAFFVAAVFVFAVKRRVSRWLVAAAAS